MRHGSLFSGIGGFDLAAEWMGWENVFQAEWDLYCQKVLAKNFPNVKRYGDIKEFDGTKYRGLIDVISGGVPCQPSSVAGQRKGEKDDRWLWPEMLRIVREVKPPFVVCENPPGILSVGNGNPFKSILSALENEGYQTELFNIPACSLTAWHKRERIWIISYNSSIGRMDRKFDKESMDGREQAFDEASPSNKLKVFPDSGLQRQEISEKQATGIEQYCKENDAHTEKQRFKTGTECYITKGQIRSSWVNDNRGKQWESEPSVGRVANGIPGRVDRLKGLGNAIVPQVAYYIFKAIEEFNNTNQ